MSAPRLIHFADPLPEPVADRPSAERAIGAPPLRETREVYGAEPGLSVGEWCCAPGAWRIAFHRGRHEFFQVLEGELRIHAATGGCRRFGPGDAGVIPAGFEGVFEVVQAVRKRYVMLDVALPAGGDCPAPATPAGTPAAPGCP